MDSLQVPRPAWMTEDLVLLEEQAKRFLAAELVPHVEKRIRFRGTYRPAFYALWFKSEVSKIDDALVPVSGPHTPLKK